MVKDKRYVIRIKKNTQMIRPAAFFAFLMVVCQPFHTLTFSGVGLLMLVGLPLLVLTVPALLARVRRTSWDRATLVLAGFLGYNILAYAWTPYFSFDSLYNYVKIIMIVICLYCQSYTKWEKKLLLLGSCVVSVLIFLFMVLGRNVGYYSDRLTVAVFGVVQDPNYMGLLFVPPMAVAVTNFTKHKSVMMRILCGGLAGICLYCVMTTGSRGALLGLIVVVIVCVINRFKSLGAKILFCAVMLAVAVILYGFILTLLPTHIAVRFTLQDILRTRGTHRWDIWMDAFRIMRESPHMLLLGFGVSASQNLLFDGWAAHNFFIQLLLELGIVGLGLFVWFFWIWYRRLRKRDTMGLSILMGCLAMSMTLSVNTIYYFWFSLMLGIVCSDTAAPQKEVQAG